MVASDNSESGRVVDQFDDEFAPYLEQAKQSPVFRAEFEDAEELHRLLDSLVKLRKALGLSQTDVANRMSIRQPAVSGFEKESSDPKISTLQRYARAVEARLCVTLEMPADCDWVSASTCKYNEAASKPTRLASPVVRHTSLASSWGRLSTRSREDEYGLSA